MARSYLVNAVDVELAAPVAAPDLTITVDDAAPLPTVPFYLVVDPFSENDGREYMLCTLVVGTTLTVTRNLDGSESTTHLTGDIVRISYVAQILDDLWDEIETASGLPSGGVIGDSLRKQSATEGDAAWDANVTIDVSEPTSPIIGDFWMDPDEVIPGATFLRLDGTAPMEAALPMGGFGVTNVAHLTAAASLFFDDDTLVTRFVMEANAFGDISWFDRVGTLISMYDESEGQWEYRTNLDMSGNTLLAGPILLDEGASITIDTGNYRAKRPAVGTSGFRLGMDSNGDIELVYEDPQGITTVSSLRLSADSAVVSVPFLIPYGNAAVPGLSFDGDPDNGMYRVGDNTIGFSTGGVAALHIGDEWIRLGSGPAGTPVIYGGAGSVAEPGYSFSSDRDTGMWRRAANSIALSVGGIDAFWLTTEGTYIRVAASTGSAANTFLDGSNLIWKSTSARKYKSQINYDVNELLDIELKPAKFYRDDDERWFYGQIADDLEEQDDIFAQYGEDGELENYDSDEVLAVVIAQLNDAKARIEVLESV